MKWFFDFLTGPLNKFAWVTVLIPTSFIVGLYYTIGTKGLQFRRFGYVMKNTIGKMFKHKETEKGSVSPFQAVTTALAATVGTGNIVGTSQAITMGGYGAVFWLWVSALLGMVIKYAEVTLSIKYRIKNDKGDWVGGPMYYIEKGLGKNWKFLAVIFAVFGALAAFGIGNMSQVNSITGAIENLISAYNPGFQNFTTIEIIVGIFLAVTAGLVLLGGIKRIGTVTEKLIPIMSLLYIVFALIVIFGNISSLGSAFQKIFSAAFTPKAAVGAATGIIYKYTIVWGIRRSAFSNEAGLGSAGIAHAAADVKEPVDQGIYGIFEVFMDTVVICSLTSIAIIVSGVDLEWGVLPNSSLVTSAFATVLGDKIAALFVAVALILFAYSTLLGWSLYGVRCSEYLFGSKSSTIYRILFILVIVLGAVCPISAVWDIADTLNGLMAIPNFIAILLLSPVVFKLTKERFSKERLDIHK